MLTTTSLHRHCLRGAPLFSTLALTVVTTLVGLAPARAEAHVAGAIDPYGCHSNNRRTGDYHCHRGDYSGITFSSKADMLEKKKAGVTSEDLRSAEADTAAGDADKPKRKWSLLPHPDDAPAANASNTPDVGSADAAIMPKGLEQRLRTLKSLHAEGLITDEEYERKKLEILGDL